MDTKVVRSDREMKKMVTTDRRMAGAAVRLHPGMVRTFMVGLVVPKGLHGRTSAATAGRLAG